MSLLMDFIKARAYANNPALARADQVRQMQQHALLIAQQASALFDPIQKQQMDPMQAALVQQQRALMESGDPALQAQALKNMGNFQDRSFSIIQPTSEIKNVESTGAPKGSEAFRQLMIRLLTKPQNEINMGGQMQMMPATREDKRLFGIPAEVPATRNNKTGEVVAHPIPVTDEQQKAGIHFKGLDRGLANLEALLPAIQLDPSKNTQDYVGSGMNDTGIPIVKTIGNMLMSQKRQKFNQALQEIKINYIHALTGGGYGIQEAEDKAQATLPQWGDDAETVAQKIATIRGVATDMRTRSGPAAYANPLDNLVKQANQQYQEYQRTLQPVSPEEAATVTPEMLKEGNARLNAPLESKTIGGKTYHKFGPGDWRVDE